MKTALHIFGAIAICLILYVGIEHVVVSNSCKKENGQWFAAPLPFAKQDSNNSWYNGAAKDIEPGGKYYEAHKKVYSSGYCILP